MNLDSMIRSAMLQSRQANSVVSLATYHTPGEVLQIIRGITNENIDVCEVDENWIDVFELPETGTAWRLSVLCGEEGVNE